MALTYEEALIKWAEKRYSLNSVTKVSLDLGTENGGFCETCEYTECIINVIVWQENDPHFYEIKNWEFSQLLSEIIQVASES